MSAGPPALDVLLTAAGAAAGPIAPDAGEVALTDLYACPPGPWVRANMVATLDGSAVGPDGRSGSINGPADHRVFTLLRSLADVVLVGAGTVRAERYRAPRTPPGLVAARRSRGQADHPPLAVVTSRGDLPLDLLREEPEPWVFTVSHAPFLGHLRAHLAPGRLHVHEGDVDLRRVLSTLASAGLEHVLTEGGPRLLGGLLSAGAVDELCLTQSPLVVGGARPLVESVGPQTARTARLGHLLHSDGFLLGRWLLAR